MAEIQKGKMTLDKFAIIMARRFDELEEKMATKEDIARLEQRMARFEYQLDEVKDMIRHLEEVDILNLQKRVVYLENELKQMKKMVSK